MSDETLSQIAAILDGDRWLSADGCAAFMGGIQRRTFLERVACLPDFPKPARVVGPRKLWRKSEVDAWIERQRSTRVA